MSGINEVFTPSEFREIENTRVEEDIVSEVNVSNQIKVEIIENEENNQPDIIAEIADPFDSCQLVDRCLSPNEQTSSRIIYYVFVIIIIILLLAIGFTLISLYRYNKLKRK